MARAGYSNSLFCGQLLLVLILNFPFHLHSFPTIPIESDLELQVEVETQLKSKCSFSHTFNSINDQAYLVSPKYPKNYPSNSNCVYAIQSPPSTQIDISCSEFNLQPSYECQQDYLSFNLNSELTDETPLQKYCDQRTINLQTKVNRLLIQFKSGFVHPSSKHPFRFNCTLTVVPLSENPIISTDSDSTNSLENDRCVCGVRNLDGESKRIVGGTTALLGEFPWRCMLISEKLGAFCGCSIISSKFILTAAHCTSAVESDDVLYVDLGDYDLSTTAETNNSIVRVAEIIQNPAYSPQTQDNDISLLRLDNPILFSSTVQSVCLPWNMRSKSFHGAGVTASGWGTRTPGGPVSDILQTVDLPILTTEECRKYYGNTVTDNMICTYAKGKDTCQGDSGSSIDYYDKVTNRYYSIGIVSWGIGCAEVNEPGVYLKVTNFLDWIQQNSGENFCRP